MPLLQTNPLTMAGRLQRCWLFTFQCAPETASSFLPAPLQPVTYAGYAFWNVVVTRIESMRPAPLPARLGISYWHAAYRLYAHFRTATGERIEGLYFIRSESDSALIRLAGNLLTDFNLHRAPIHCRETGETVTLTIASADEPAAIHLRRRAPTWLPVTSPFASLDEANAFLKYEPYGLSVNRAGRVNVVRVLRSEAAWQSHLCTVIEAYWAFFAGQEVRPLLCYEVAPVDYRWQRGQLVSAGRSR